TVQTPQQWTLYKKEMNTFILKVTSSEARFKNQLYVKTYPLYIYMKGFYIPGFDPFLAVLAIAFIAVIFKRRQDLEDESLGRYF
ncbi:MAG: hypothetical protein KAQ96_15155, partial [Thermoplasmata archaeon]|nr:hypothetical protein [Thermoplasmata archaeon]